MRVFSIYILVCLSQNLLAFDFDLDKIIETVQNLTRAINNAEQEGQMFYDMANKTLPQLMTDLGKIGELPESVQLAVNAVNTHLPQVETCIYVFGGCLVSSALILSLPKIIKYYKKRRPSLGLEEVVHDRH